MSYISQTYIIQAPLNQVWKALTDPDMIDEWGGGPATMDEEVGTNFELWGGDIWGKNIEVDAKRHLKQEWFGGEWEQPSIVSYDLTGNNKETTVVITQEGMPESEKKKLEEGWRDSFFEPIKKFLEKSE